MPNSYNGGSVRTAGNGRSTSAFDGPEGGVFIGRGTHVVGEISECTKVVIRGSIEGNIDTIELVIEEDGAIKGNIRAERMQINGRIDGNALISDLVDIRSTGVITGELVYGQLSVAAGGQVHGAIRQQGLNGANGGPAHEHGTGAAV